MGSMTSTTAHNRPHRPAIHYSAKGYDEYRADLLQRLVENGFGVKEDEQDFLNAFIDLTAYLGEVLMTYQNAYAQEIYLETAQSRESLFGLALMVDYRIRPGSAATGTLVVTAKSAKSGLLPKGFLVSGKEENAKEDVFFETDADLQVDATFNDFSLTDAERFIDLTINAGDAFLTLTLKEKAAAVSGQYLYCAIGSSQNHYFGLVQSATIDEEEETTEIAVALQHSSATGSVSVKDGVWGLIPPGAKGVYALTSNVGNKTSKVWLDNKYEDLAVNSPVVMHSGTKTAYGIVTLVSFVPVYIKASATTRISDSLTLGANETKETEYEVTVAGNVKKYYLIRKQNMETREVCKLAIAWQGNDMPDAWGSDPSTAANAAEKSSTHIVFAGIQTPLTVETKTKNTTSLQGRRVLKTEGDLSSMEKYRSLILHEKKSDGKTHIEQAAVFSVSYDVAGTSTITLKEPIDGDFTKHGVKIWGNVVTMTQGKTVSETILGSGAGEESYQAFDVPRSPLTFEMHGKEGLEGAIDIKVSDLVWTQQDDFLDSKPGDRHYVIETDYAGESRAVFGDGVNGSRLPTGTDNVVAQFRTGQGTSGNVSSGILKKAASKPPFLDKMSNPDKTSGGSDPDTEEQLREKIPTRHITFDRAVSLQDYADLALSCSGVSKAKAGRRWMHNRAYIVLAVAGSGGEDLSADALKTLREYIDARRDSNQPLLVKQVDIAPIELSVSITASAGYDTDRVKDAVAKALGTETLADGTYPFFSFERLGIGMSIHKKDVYTIIENIPGVEQITRLEITRSTEPAGQIKPSFCPDDVWIYNWELPELDVDNLDITVTPQQTGTLCEEAGG